MTVKFIDSVPLPEYPLPYTHKFQVGLAYEDQKGDVYIAVDPDTGSEKVPSGKFALLQVYSRAEAGNDWALHTSKHLPGRNFREISLTIKKD